MKLYHLVFLLFAVTGVYLNNHKNRLCFPLWIVSNFGWLCVNAYHSLYIESLQNLIFLGLAFHGAYKWRK
jgi:nicotinamide riboside transporter PnuC